MSLLVHFAALLIAAVPATGATMQTSIGEAPGPDLVRIDGKEVPYSVRVEALLEAIATLHEEDLANRADRLSSFLASFGLNPESVAARGLVDLATRLEASRSDVLSAEQVEAFGDDDVGLGALQDRLRRQRFEEIGYGFGQWLSECERERLAVEPLLDRLLNSSYLSTSIYSNEGAEADARHLALLAKAFNGALERSYGRVPRRLQ